MGYCDNMLTGIRIFTSDAVWRQILGDLNATVLESPGYMDVNLDDVEFDGPISLSFSPISIPLNSPLTIRDNALFGSPWLPVERIKISLSL